MNEPIKNLKDGDRLYGQYLVADNKTGVAKTGKRYLFATLQDSSSSFEIKNWNANDEDISNFEPGNVLEVEAVVSGSGSNLQVKVISATKLDLETVDWSRLLASAPVSETTLKAKLKAYLDSIKDEDIKTLVLGVLSKFKDRYLTWPAAKKNHHNYVNGLLYHSITMTDMAHEVCKVYPSLNRDVVIGGTILHDIGKSIELSGIKATEYTLEGRLLGHLCIGAAELRETAKSLGYFAYDELKDNEDEATRNKLFKKKEIAVIFEHILLSHHTKPEFGSPIAPLTREAFAVANIDDFDSKMNMLDKAYEEIKKGEFTEKLFTMDNRCFYKPTYSKDDVPPAGLEKIDD